jgi:hypothetical protein
MRFNCNILSIKKLLMAALLLPLLQATGCVFDPQQFAAFISSQTYQLASRGFQSGFGQLLDHWVNNIY